MLGIKSKKKIRLFFSKCSFSSYNIFLPGTYPVNSNFISGAQMCNIRVFVKIFFPVWNCCYDNWNSVFSPIVIATTVKRDKFLQHNYAANQWKLPLKNEVKQIKINQEKLSPSCIFFPTVKDPDPSNGEKKQQK